jgi:hypothetical protein
MNPSFGSVNLEKWIVEPGAANTAIRDAIVETNFNWSVLSRRRR